MAPQERIVPMKVLVLSVQRTGSLSVRQALRQLGFHDVCHMHSVTEDMSRIPLWTRAVEAKFKDRAHPEPLPRAFWDEILYDCQAVVDLPAGFFGPELVAAYPEARVVVLGRDEDAWYRSVLSTFGEMMHQPGRPWQKVRFLFAMLLDPTTRRFARFSLSMRGLAVGFDWADPGSEGRARQWFRDTYQEYRELARPEKRLDYRVTEGWGPLCKFLDVPVPMVKDEDGKLAEMPFPRTNDRDSFLAKYRSIVDSCVDRATTNLVLGVGKLSLAGLVGYASLIVYRRLR